MVKHQRYSNVWREQMFLTLALIVVFSGLRVTMVGSELPNIMPLMAVAFTSSAYLNSRYHWLMPVAIMSLSDILINHSYGFSPVSLWSLVGGCCYIAAALFGKYMINTKSWLSLLFGTVAMTFLFYFVSNTFVFLTSSSYGATLSEWLRSLTVGIPGYPPTYVFLRNSLIGDLSFTLFFIAVTEASRFSLKRQNYQALPLY